MPANAASDRRGCCLLGVCFGKLGIDRHRHRVYTTFHLQRDRALTTDGEKANFSPCRDPKS